MKQKEISKQAILYLHYIQVTQLVSSRSSMAVIFLNSSVISAPSSTSKSIRSSDSQFAVVAAVSPCVCEAWKSVNELSDC